MSNASSIALYVHIPFCETKCPYCDFNTYAAIEPLMPAYGKALQAEIALWGALLHSSQVHSVFFGGGTPSYLPAEHIQRALRTIRGAFRLQPDAEVTLEANPGDFTARKLDAYLACGVNRLSIGVQSFDDGLLKVLGRRHTAADAAAAYRMASTAGFRDISIDLMYGLPYQRLEQWRRTLGKALELAPPHISMYCLTLEGGTPMEQWTAQGSMPEPDADLAADMYTMAQTETARHGYRHYEISNWAQPNMLSRHNLTYWRNEPYLGVGPGAHSYLCKRRFHNIKSPREYIRRMQAAPVPASAAPPPDAIDAISAVPVVEDVERIDKSLEMSETLMMGLRLDSGVSIDGFANRFGAPPSRYYAAAIADLTALGLLHTQDGALRLTERGKMMGNQVFSRFF